MANTLSLAALEYLVHVDRSMLPPDLVQIEIDVPDSVKVSDVDVGSLPRDWRTYPAPVALQRIGDEWIAEGATAVLRVPSAVIPEENNFLLNAEHPDTGGFRVVSQGAFRYDSRLRA